MSAPVRLRGKPPGGGLGPAVAAVLLLGCVARQERLPAGVIAVEETEQTAAFVRNFNPLLEAGAVRWPTRRAMYEPMLVHNPLSGRYVPWLADRVQLETRTTSSCASSIRPGVSWSDGAPFSARDVAFTFDLLRRFPALDARGLWEHLESVATDGEVVVVTLNKAHVPALEPIAQQAIVPEHRWRTVADPVAFANETPVATGPFTEITFFQPAGLRGGAQPALLAGRWPGCAGCAFGPIPPTSRPSWPCCTTSSTGPARSSPPSTASTWPAIPSTITTGSPCSTRPCSCTPTPPARRWTTCACARPSAWPSTARSIVRIAMHGYTRPADATGLSDAYARYRDPAAVAAGDWVVHDPARAAAAAGRGRPPARGRRPPAWPRRAAAGADPAGAGRLLRLDRRRPDRRPGPARGGPGGQPAHPRGERLVREAADRGLRSVDGLVGSGDHAVRVLSLADVHRHRPARWGRRRRRTGTASACPRPTGCWPTWRTRSIRTRSGA